MDRPAASKARRRILETEKARAGHVQTVLGASAMIEGSFVTLGRKCGKEGCRCATGDKHYSKFVSRSVAGRTKLTYVPAGDEVGVAAKTERYRRFREARAELMKLAQQTAALVDGLQEELSEPYPPPSEKKSSAKSSRRKKKNSSAG